jgi:hypothetical protein
MSFDTTHKGFAIEYLEHSSTWHCAELGLDAGQLNALRKLIDKSDADRRRVNIPALRLGGRWTMQNKREQELVGCTITLLIDGKEVWIKNEKGEREKEYAANLFPDTNETREAHQRYLAACEDHATARQVMENAKAAIPRVSLPTGITPGDR